MNAKWMLHTALAFGMIAGIAAAATPLMNAITYQGQLKREGLPLDDLVDLRFTLWDAAVGGNADPDVRTFSAFQVANGLFTVDLDFGADAFNGSAKWIAVEVRHPAGSGSFVPMSARQPINAAPYSLFSLNTFWRSSGDAITNTNTGFVGINRSSAVTGAEYFGIQAPVAGTSYGGMYIRTDSATARPFYGYTTGSQTAWTYLDGATGSWNVYNSGVRLTIADNGNVGIGTATPVAKLQIYAPLATLSSGGGVVVGATDSFNIAIDDYEILGRYNGSASSLFLNSYGGDVDLVPSGPGSVGIGTSAPAAKLHVVGGTDTAPTGGGFAVFGNTNSINISIDNNEIMARNNGAPATLTLNQAGGDVAFGGSIDIGLETIVGVHAGQVSARCSPGKKVIGGGCAVPTGADRVELTQPDADGLGWYCQVGLGATARATAICANVK